MSTEMEGSDLALVCLCGFESFTRVIVERRPASPIVTDFVACVGCSAMYWSPRAAKPADPLLERDAAIAARSYRKPGRR
jgi:hypothetical protein